MYHGLVFHPSHDQSQCPMILESLFAQAITRPCALRKGREKEKVKGGKKGGKKKQSKRISC